MPRPPQLQYLRIDSFAPGITSAKLTSGVFGKSINRVSPDEPIQAAAHDDLTYGCKASPSGGLVPLPARTDEIAQAMLHPTVSGNRYPSGQARMVTLAAGIASPMRPSLADDINPTQTHHDQLFLTWGYFHDVLNAGNFSYHVRTRTFKTHIATTPTYDLFTIAHADMWGASSASTYYTSPYKHGWFNLIETVQKDAAFPTAYPVMTAFHFLYRGNGASAANFSSYPDVTATGTDGVVSRSSYQVYQACSHQGRIVMAADSGDLFGSSGGVSTFLFGGEDLAYFPVRDHQVASTSQIQNFLEENQSGVRVMASMNANELFIIKARGGGAIIRGSLDEPEIVRLPGLYSPGEIYSKAAVTPLGVVYGGPGGVYLWNGGDVSEHLSANIDNGEFWIPKDTSSVRLGNLGEFAFSDPFIIAPNGYIFDTQSGGWWKLDTDSATGETFSHLTSGQRGFWAIPAQIDASHSVAAYYYDPSTPTSYYQWESQPFFQSLREKTSVREILLLVEGAGTYSVYVLDEDGNTVSFGSQSVTDDYVVKMLRFNGRIDCYLPQVILQSEASPGDPAGTIHKMELGVMSSRTVGAS